MKGATDRQGKEGLSSPLASVQSLHYLVRKGMGMPQIQLTASLSIWFYPRDHAPPHFHVIGPDTAVMVDLRDFQVIEGSYKRRDLRAALAFAADHLDELWQAWREQHDELR